MAVLTLHADFDLAHADWPKRTPDTFEALGIANQFTEGVAVLEHLPGQHDQSTHGRKKAGGNGQAQKQTETAAFKRWFGDSKVVDEDGEPLVVYHGTAEDFDEFIPGGHDATTSGPAIWFSDKKHAGQKSAHHTTGRETGSRIIPVYLKIERPLVLDDRTTWEWARDVYGDGSSDFPLLLKNKHVEAIKADGYDGVLFSVSSFMTGNILPSERKASEFIVFESTQIKSIHNRGTWDESKPSILESKKTAFVNRLLWERYP